MSMNLENRISNEQLVSRIQSGEDEAENMLKLWEQNRKFITMMEVCRPGRDGRSGAGRIYWPV